MPPPRAPGSAAPAPRSASPPGLRAGRTCRRRGHRAPRRIPRTRAERSAGARPSVRVRARGPSARRERTTPQPLTHAGKPGTSAGARRTKTGQAEHRRTLRVVPRIDLGAHIVSTLEPLEERPRPARSRATSGSCSSTVSRSSTPSARGRCSRTGPSSTPKTAGPSRASRPTVDRSPLPRTSSWVPTTPWTVRRPGHPHPPGRLGTRRLLKDAVHLTGSARNARRSR